MMTLKTIKSVDPEGGDIDIDKNDHGDYLISQYYVGCTQSIKFTKQSLSELGQYLISLDLDK